VSEPLVVQQRKKRAHELVEIMRLPIRNTVSQSRELEPGQYAINVTAPCMFSIGRKFSDPPELGQRIGPGRHDFAILGREGAVWLRSLNGGITSAEILRRPPV
jgi:hypothetical protein